MPRVRKNALRRTRANRAGRIAVTRYATWQKARLSEQSSAGKLARRARNDWTLLRKFLNIEFSPARQIFLNLQFCIALSFDAFESVPDSKGWSAISTSSSSGVCQVGCWSM